MCCCGSLGARPKGCGATPCARCLQRACSCKPCCYKKQVPRLESTFYDFPISSKPVLLHRHPVFRGASGRSLSSSLSCLLELPLAIDGVRKAFLASIPCNSVLARQNQSCGACYSETKISAVAPANKKPEHFATSQPLKPRYRYYRRYRCDRRAKGSSVNVKRDYCASLLVYIQPLAQ